MIEKYRIAKSSIIPVVAVSFIPCNAISPILVGKMPIKAPIIEKTNGTSTKAVNGVNFFFIIKNINVITIAYEKNVTIAILLFSYLFLIIFKKSNIFTN